MELVKIAEEFAEKKHFGQVDRAGVAYIEHPRTVASRVDGELEKVVAFLHDTVEDTDTTVEEIRSIFGDEVAEAVSCLTREKGVSYRQYIEKIKGNELARKVKLADLSHNMELSRLPNVTKSDIERVEKRYKKAVEILSK